MTWIGLPEGFIANQKEHEGFVYRIDNISTGLLHREEELLDKTERQEDREEGY